MFMRLQLRNFASLLLLIGGINVTPALFAQTTDLTLALIDARLGSFRDNGAATADGRIQAYEAARDRLNDADSFDRDTARYVRALSSASSKEIPADASG